jgi:hypothetical protein
VQVWRWPVDDTSLNVFVRWGGANDARDCSGEVRLIDAASYVWTPFHVEDGDVVEEVQQGVFRWHTTAEAGTGDGLNLHVVIDPRQRARVVLDAQRGGQRRPAEVSVQTGPATSLPLELELVQWRPKRWLGEVDLPALQPGETRHLEVPWPATAAREGKLVCRAVP